jgi:hypothetical protein
MKNLKMLLLIPAIGLSLAGCGAVAFDGTCSNGHCSGTVAPVNGSTPAPDNSVSSSANVPGTTPAPTVTVTRYVYVVQQCFPDPTENQLTSLADDVPYCLQIPGDEAGYFLKIIQQDLDQTPRSQFHTQQGRDEWRDHQLADAVRQAYQQGG